MAWRYQLHTYSTEDGKYGIEGTVERRTANEHSMNTYTCGVYFDTEDEAVEYVLQQLTAKGVAKENIVIEKQ